MRLFVLSLVLGAGLGLAACGGKTSVPASGDPFVPPGDPGGGGDNVGADSDAGDATPGDAGGDGGGDELLPGDDSPPVVLTPSVQFCGAGGQVSSASYHGVLCLSPLGSSGQVSTSSSYELISAPAHIVEAK